MRDSHPKQPDHRPILALTAQPGNASTNEVYSWQTFTPALRPSSDHQSPRANGYFSLPPLDALSPDAPVITNYNSDPLIFTDCNIVKLLRFRLLNSLLDSIWLYFSSINLFPQVIH